VALGGVIVGSGLGDLGTWSVLKTELVVAGVLLIFVGLFVRESGSEILS
jgi:hypothetical protein